MTISLPSLFFRLSLAGAMLAVVAMASPVAKADCGGGGCGAKKDCPSPSPSPKK